MRFLRQKSADQRAAANPPDASARAAAILPALGGDAGAASSEDCGASVTLAQSWLVALLSVAESSPDVLALFDLERNCVFLNRPIHGLTPSSWRGAPVESFAPPADRARVREIFEHVIASGAPFDFEQAFTGPDHRPRRLEMRMHAVRSGEATLGAAVNITDVTEQRAQRDTLRTQARILETMREGVVLVDAAELTIRLTNRMFERLFGYPAGELIGQSVEPLISLPGARRERFERSLRELGGTGAAVELECIRRDNSRFIASCVISPLSTGGVDHWLAVLNDITESKRLQRGIIEIANRERQRIGSDLHDGLGQELTGIALMLRGVAARLSKEESAARLDVEDVIGLVNDAIENTRTLARGLSPVGAAHGGLVDALRALAAHATDRYGLHVEFRHCVTVPLQLDDNCATHLYRIAQEALTNVVRHSSASQVTICLDTTGEELQLRIDDNGCGFIPREPGGITGLGLKMMQYRAQMLRGDLLLETSAAGGASVRCSCPLEQ